MQLDVTPSFVSSTSIMASVWTVIRCEWWDGFSANDIKYSKTSNRVHIILLFHGGASRAFEAPTPRCTRIDGSLFRTNESKIFVATRINKIRVLSRVLLHMSRDSVRTSCLFIFIVILSSSLSWENTAQVHKLKLLSIYKINKNIENR